MIPNIAIVFSTLYLIEIIYRVDGIAISNLPALLFRFFLLFLWLIIRCSDSLIVMYNYLIPSVNFSGMN
jgi:hypothetical protein